MVKLIIGVSNELGMAICEMVGINAGNVEQIQIDLKASSVATIKIWGYWDSETDKLLAPKLREYKIIPK